MKSRSWSATVSLVMLAGSFFSWAQSGGPAHSSAVNDGQLSGTPMQQDAPMKVTCKGDQLTISANGSSLSTILSEVSRCSGAKIDGSEAATRMRFFETIGPAPIQEVLSSLLDASGINYVIQVSDSNPRKIATVLLLARADHGSPGDLSDDPTLSAGRRAFLKQARQNSRDTEEAPENAEQPAAVETRAAENFATDNPTPVPTPLEPPPPPTAARVPSAAVDSTPASSQMNLQDRITEMQRMFEQRKQMVQNQTPRSH